MNRIESMLVEAVGNLFKNSSNVLGIVDVDREEVAHNFEFQWNGIEDMFALKTRTSTFHEELTSAFRDIHSYKYLDSPTFQVALEKRLTARGIPTAEIEKAKQYCEEIKKELKSKNFQEKDAGWHPHLDEVLDTTRNANDRKPSKEVPYTGGGPVPSRNEIG